MSDDLDSFLNSKKSKKDKNKNKKTAAKASDDKQDVSKGKKAQDNQEFDDVENETIKKVNIGDKIKIKSAAEVEAQEVKEEKKEEKKEEVKPKQEEKKKDASNISFGGRPTFQKANKGTNLKTEEFPDLDNVGKVEQPKAKKEHKEHKEFKPITKSDGPAVFERAAPVAEVQREEKKDITFGSVRPTFSKQNKKPEEQKTLDPINKDNMDVGQRKLLELMEKDMQERDKARQRAQERKERIDRGEEEPRAYRQEPKPEREEEEEQPMRTEIRRGGGRGHRGGFRGGLQAQERNVAKEAHIEADEDFQMVTEKKKKVYEARPQQKEEEGGFIKRGANKFSGFKDE